MTPIHPRHASKAERRRVKFPSNEGSGCLATFLCVSEPEREIKGKRLH